MRVSKDNPKANSVLLSYRAISRKRQVDVANDADVPQQIYSGMERGERRPATLEVAERIAKALNAPVGIVFPEFAEAKNASSDEVNVHAAE